jgi:hypothetical protein
LLSPHTFVLKTIHKYEAQINEILTQQFWHTMKSNFNNFLRMLGLVWGEKYFLTIDLEIFKL